MNTLSGLLNELTYDDLDRWAGEKIRTRGKAYVGRVAGLHRTEQGHLVAWVSGTEEYATLVRLGDGGVRSWFCTCPYDGGPCKHTVAVILAAAQQVKHKRDIPLLSEDDDLHLVLFGDRDDEPAWEDEQPPVEGPVGGESAGKLEKTGLRRMLEGKTREELVELLARLATDFPAVARALAEAEQLKCGRIEPLVRSLRREIATLTSEPAWSSTWSDERDIPDYSHVRQQFATLLAAGHGDILLALGDDLWRRGHEQVAQSDDEGETGEAIAGCLDIVLRAVRQSSLPPAEQLLWVIDRLMTDEYGLLHSGEQLLLDPVYGPEDWHRVASILEQRLADGPAQSGRAFQRGALLDRLLDAYRRSSQPDKIVPVLEREVDTLGNYGQLVDVLLETGEVDRAREWCLHGFARTVKERAGFAEGLQERLRRIDELLNRHDLVAAHRSESFFRLPCLERYRELRKATEKLGCWPAVRAGVLGYLETGRRPDGPAKKGETTPWPLPEPEVRFPPDKARGAIRGHFPDRQTLIDIAIAEKRFDDVVALHRALVKDRAGSTSLDQTVAKAVAKTHPEVAIAIWRRLVDGLIAQVKPRAYVEAGTFLRQIHKVYMESGRSAQWDGLLSELRRTHKAKRRLLEVLDSLAGATRKIVG